MRKALVVGINYYAAGGALVGCVDDAHRVKAILERHGDGSVNFDVALLTATGPSDPVERATLKDGIEELFLGDSEIALFYFAGHGHIGATGGYILASDSRRGDEGVPLAELITLANNSRARNKVVVLDSCHSGIAGSAPSAGDHALLAEGLTILTASTKDQYASEDKSGGVFTNLLVDALSGGASNLVGDISPGGVYAHIDQSLGPWDQRPVFKTNVKNFISLRRVPAPIPLADLRRIAEFFPASGAEFQLDPSYEPETRGRPEGVALPIDEHAAIFAILQKLNRVNLVVPVNAPHMWHAAMESKSCRLTVLGEHYRRLVATKRL